MNIQEAREFARVNRKMLITLAGREHVDGKIRYEDDGIRYVDDMRDRVPYRIYTELDLYKK